MAARIAQVFDNLIGDAMKFTPTGGQITIRAVPAVGECITASPIPAAGIT